MYISKATVKAVSACHGRPRPLVKQYPSPIPAKPLSDLVHCHDGHDSYMVGGSSGLEGLPIGVLSELLA